MLGKEEFLNILEKAAYHNSQLEECLDKVFREVDLSQIEVDATNATNLEEAICCYVHYGEGTLSGDVNELYDLYMKAFNI